MKLSFQVPLFLFVLVYFLPSHLPAQDLEAWATVKSQAVAGQVDPDKYVVGPGDLFAVGIWGEKKFVYELPVSIEGNLLIPEVGSIAVNHVTITRLRELVIEKVQKVFTRVDVTLTLKRVRIFRATVAGEVKHPGVYLASAMDRASDIIQQAGGLLDNASKRRLQVVRGTDTLAVDLAAFWDLGREDENPFLREGDVIFVPVLKDVISFWGAIHKKGDYEIIPGETIADILPFTGGFVAEALLDSIELARFDENGFQIEKLILNWNAAAPSWKLQKDDRLMVRRRAKWHFKRGVWIEGEVYHPGYYAINRGETTLSESIDAAGGFTDEASLVEARVIRGPEASRTDPEFERLKKMNPADMNEMEYSYFKNKSQEIPGAMAVDFERLFTRGDLAQDIVLQDGDRVIIPHLRNYILVSGQVLFAGNITYHPNLGIDDYIRLAGGFSWNARKNKLRIIKARTGEWVKKTSVKRLEPGDTIWVPEKPERDWWLRFRQFMTVAAQGATLYLVVKTAIK